jgi:hypothetical protein
VAFGLLATAATGSYDSVFVVSFGFATLGLAVLVVLVPNRRTSSGVARQRIGALLRQIGGRRLRRPLVVAALLGLCTIGDSFLYLTIQDRDGFGVMVFPLLFVGTNAAYLALAIPMGRLADRVGRARCSSRAMSRCCWPTSRRPRRGTVPRRRSSACCYSGRSTPRPTASSPH